MRRDDGVTEAVGFIFVISVFLILVTVWLMFAAPTIGENGEYDHNDRVKVEFFEIKTDIDTLCFSDTRGVKRESIISLSPSGDDSKVTILPDIYARMAYGDMELSYAGDVTDAYGTSYHTINMTYRTANMYADDVTLRYNSSLFFGGEQVAGPLYKGGTEYLVVVDDRTKNQSVGGTEALTVSYMLSNVTQSADGKKYFVFTMELKK